MVSMKEKRSFQWFEALSPKNGLSDYIIETYQIGSFRERFPQFLIPTISVRFIKLRLQRDTVPREQRKKIGDKTSTIRTTRWITYGRGDLLFILCIQKKMLISPILLYNTVECRCFSATWRRWQSCMKINAKLIKHHDKSTNKHWKTKFLLQILL